jgi:CheY-like chemotaxis protein
MAIFGFGKDKKDNGGATEQVLAYLEDAQRTRAAFTLVGPRKAEVSATLQGIDETDGLITFQTSLSLAADKGARVEFLFFAEGLRLSGSASIAEKRGNLVQVALPDTLAVKERRAHPRARLNPKEGTTLTALTGLFDGVGITGVVENLSEGGARIRVEKAMNLKGEKRLPLGVALVPAGQPFLLIKLNKAPKCPSVMELTGKAVFLDTSAGGLTMGLAFDPLRPDLASALRALVASRTTPIPASLPPKNRRKPEAPVAQANEPIHPAEPEARIEARPEAPKEPERAAVATTTPASEAPEAAAPQPAKNDVLTRLKKRSRAVVALAASPAFGDLLKEHLQEEGYGRVLVTHSQKDFLEFLQQPNLAVLFIDGNFSTLDALQFVTQLRSSHQELPPIILAVEEASTAIVLAAHRNGVSQILVKPYALDGAFSELLSQQMGL